MRSFRARLATLISAAIACMLITPSASRAEVGGFHLNITPYAGFNTWASETNAQDKTLYGGRLGLGFGKRIGIEGTYGVSSTQTQEKLGGQAYTSTVAPLAAVQDNNFTHTAADLVLNLAPGGSIDPYLTGGWSQVKFEPQDSTSNNSTISGFDIGAGLKLHFSPRVALRLEARDMMYSWDDKQTGNGASTKSQNSMAYTGGLQFSLGGSTTMKDADLDGVADKKDQCPNTPAGAVVDANGCPIDTDGDGVPDGIDTCANTPKGAQVDEKGCPKDSDGDGVFDGIDTCPGTAAGCKVDEKGCPVDSDADGVCDGVDQCANTPSGARVDEKGCPVDSDGDGVADGLDQCPNTPAGARVDKDGCPIELTNREVEMLDKGVITARDIYFDTGKSTLKPESEATLKELCSIFQQWPSLKVEIGGHTDAQGSNATNDKLSQERADAVEGWLKGNCPNSGTGDFTTKGYGESKPVASNGTAKGRATNRRVEFRITNPEELKRIKERREVLMKESGK